MSRAAQESPRPIANAGSSTSEYAPWFNGFIKNLRNDQESLESGNADTEKAKLYRNLMEGNLSEILSQSRSAAQQYFVQKMVFQYLSLIKPLNYSKVAFHNTDSEVLVWAVLKDDDWDTEGAMIMAEAKVNHEFHKYGFSMTSLYLEESDRLEVPAHYSTF